MTAARSTATLQIDWCRPDLEAERWEFFKHPAKQSFYRRHSLVWEGLEAAFAAGDMVLYRRGNDLAGVSVGLAYAGYDDYLTYLAAAKRNYRQSYVRLERDLQRHRLLTLPAPIVLVAGEEGLLFSGWRRLCLAWNYGMVPYVWRVSLPAQVRGE